MPLVISDDGTRSEYEIGGSTFHYTACGWGELRAIRAEKRDKDTLRVEDGDVELEIIKRHVHHWENVQDPTGMPVPFSMKALLLLPPLVVESLVQIVLAGVTKENEQQGNSDGSSDT